MNAFATPTPDHVSRLISRIDLVREDGGTTLFLDGMRIGRVSSQTYPGLDEHDLGPLVVYAGVTCPPLTSDHTIGLAFEDVCQDLLAFAGAFRDHDWSVHDIWMVTSDLILRDLGQALRAA